MKDCWNSIGVRGDRSCLELVEYVHCRHCPVYSSSARTMLDGQLPAGYTADWARHFAQPKAVVDSATEAVLIFRIGHEWLALSTPIVWEITELRPIHSLPHRAPGAVLGFVSVRGELLVCVSLGRLLGLDSHEPAGVLQSRPAQNRLLVIRHEGVRVVCLADEVDGIHRLRPDELKAVPSTVARAAASHSRGVLSSRGRAVGVLDDQRLFHAIQQGLA